MSDNLHPDYEGIICEAVDTIVTSKIQELAFDETVVCTITKIIDENKGQYEVTDGSVNFIAYNNTTKTYRVNSKVYVTVPKGDYGQEKLIIGTYKQDDDKPISFTSPKEQILELIKVCDTSVNKGLVANGSMKELEIGSVSLTDKDSSLLAACDAIYISAKFRSFLDSKKRISGSYGIRLNMFTKTGLEYVATLDSQQDMFGNPYSYSISSLQEVACSIPAGDTISKIDIYFYQKADFTNIALAEPSVENLWIDSLEIGMGMNVEGVENQTAMIIPPSDLNYDSTTESKNVRLLWINKNNSNKYIGFEDGVKATDEEQKKLAKGEQQKEDTDTNTYYYIQWEYDVANGARDTLIDADNQTVANIPCAHNSIKTGVTVTVWRDGIPHTDSIDFNNIDSAATDPFINMGITLTLKHGDESQSLCTLYGANNKLLDPYEGYRERIIEWGWNYSGTLENKFWDGAEIKWELPVNDLTTMITYDKEHYENTFIIYSGETVPGEDDVEKKIKYVKLEDTRKFKYKIKDTYSPLKTDNTITCTVTKGNETVKHSISASLLLLFQPTGTMGTAYTLTVSPSPEHEKGFTASGSGDLLEHYVGTLYDSDGNTMDTAVELKYYPILVDKFKPEQYNVIQAEASVEFTTLSIFYPVIYSKDGKYNASAPIRVIYDSFGKIQGALSYQLKLYEDNQELTNIRWQLGGFNEREDYGFEIRNNQIKLPAMYLSNFKNLRYSLQAINAEGVILWSAPLIIEQYVYQSEIFNNWDGSLQIDNEGNKILAAQGIFGGKNSDNTFTGVALGELTDIIAGYNKNGILGFNEGAQSFGFLNDGSAFIGKSGYGRILFDGTGGVIASGSWQKEDGTIKDELDTDESGTKIDLTEATFDFTGKAGNYLRLNEKGQLSAKLSELKFTIGDNKDATPETLLEMTGDKITSAIRKSTSYYGTSEWVDTIRYLTIKVDKDFFDSLETEEDDSTRLKTLPFQNGTIISVYFMDDRQSKVYNDETQQEEKGPEADAVNFYVEFSYDSNKPTKKYGMPDGTSAGQPIGFLPLKIWEIGDTFNFVYNLSASKLSPTSISSSEITQTADEIKAEVKSDVEGVVQSSITQKANEIKTEVKKDIEGIQSSITQTATDIRAEVKNDIEGVQASITQTAKDIRTEVSNANTGLATRIDQTEKSIASITQQTISYYGTSWWETDERKRIVEIDLTKEKFEGLKVKDLGSDKKVATLSNFETGTAFSIKFQDDRQSKVYNDETQQDEAGPEADDVNFDVIFTATYTETGEKEEKKHELNLEQPLVLNPADTQWTAGGALGFIYEDSQLILNSISMSTITQTAGGIVSEVKDVIDADISSKVQQLQGEISSAVTGLASKTDVQQAADNITATVSQIIQYEGVSKYVKENSSRYIEFTLPKDIYNLINTGNNPIRDGAIVSIRFRDKRQLGNFNEETNEYDGPEAEGLNNITVKFINSGNEKVVDSKFQLTTNNDDLNLTWNAGETLNFIYNSDGDKFILTAVSTSILKQTAEGIKLSIKEDTDDKYVELKARIDGLSSIIAEKVSYRGTSEFGKRDISAESRRYLTLSIDQKAYDALEIESANNPIIKDFKFKDGSIFLVEFRDKRQLGNFNEETDEYDGPEKDAIKFYVEFKSESNAEGAKYLQGPIGIINLNDWEKNDNVSFIYDLSENEMMPTSISSSEINQKIDSIESRVTTAEGGINSLRITDQKIQAQVEGAEGNITSLTLKVNGLESTVQTVNGNYSTIEQKVDNITSTVAQVVNYYGENAYNTTNKAYETIIFVSDEIWSVVEQNTIPFIDGTLISIHFKNAYDEKIKNNKRIIFKNHDKEKTFNDIEIKLSGWEQNETLSFVYKINGSSKQLIPTTVSSSQIKQEANKISLSVDSKVQELTESIDETVATKVEEILPGEIEDQVNSQITEITKDYATKSELSVLENGININAGKYEEVSKRITSVSDQTNEKFKSINNSITSLNSRITTAVDQINLKVSQSKYDSDIEEIDGKFTTVNANIETVQGEIAVKADSIMSTIYERTGYVCTATFKSFEGGVEHYELLISVDKITYNAMKIDDWFIDGTNFSIEFNHSSKRQYSKMDLGEIVFEPYIQYWDSDKEAWSEEKAIGYALDSNGELFLRTLHWECSFPWSASEIINFTFTDDHNLFEPSFMTASALKQLSSEFVASVWVGDEAFSWSLTKDGFYLNDSRLASEEDYVFKCDSNGVKINGSIVTNSIIASDNWFDQNGELKEESEVSSGLKIDLDNSRIVANDFMLKSSNVYLKGWANQSDDYYMYIGDMSDETEPHISFNSEGELNVRATNFNLTGREINPNLLFRGNQYSQKNPLTTYSPEADDFINPIMDKIVGHMIAGKTYTLSGIINMHVYDFVTLEINERVQTEPLTWEDNPINTQRISDLSIEIPPDIEIPPEAEEELIEVPFIYTFNAYAGDELVAGDSPIYQGLDSIVTVNIITGVEYDPQSIADIYCYNFKLESGDVVTDWLPPASEFMINQGIFYNDKLLDINANTIVATDGLQANRINGHSIQWQTITLDDATQVMVLCANV